MSINNYVPNIVFYFLSSLFLFLNSLTTAVAQQSGDISYMSSGGKLKPLQALMDVRHYRLDLEVDIQEQRIEGFAEIEIILSKPTDTLLFDLYKAYQVKSVDLDSKSERFLHEGDSILITKAGGFKNGKHKVRISYSGVPPVAVRPPWKGGFTWTKDKNGNPWIAINCQLEGAKVYFPCKDHPSDEPNEGVDMRITVPTGLTVAGPGVLQSVKEKGAKHTWHWKTNYTISNYCIVFNVGKYKVVKETYTTVEGNKVPVEFYVLEQDIEHASSILALRMRDAKILEKYFGEYPWVKEKMGIAQVPNPGMEHQTMITYGDRFTFDKVGGHNYSPNLFHEFGHEWWANKVTNKDWAHMWIQEGINTYAEALCFKELAGERGYDSLMTAFRSSIANLKPVVQGESLDMARVYNGDIYTKGAFFMHTLRYVMGDDVFFPTLKKFITEVKYPYSQFFDTDEIAAFFSRESKKDLQPLFDFYLRTTRKMEFEIFERRLNNYSIQLKDSPIDLQLEVLTSDGLKKYQLKAGKNLPIHLQSNTPPVVDPRNWYFKKVIFN